MRDPSARKQLIRWVHRIGYICTFLILAEVLVLALLIVADWCRRRNLRAEYQALSSVRQGTLAENLLSINAKNSALARLSAVSPVARLGPESVRLGVNPSLFRYAYAVAIRETGGVADGLVIVFERPESGRSKKTAYRFQALVVVFETLMAQFDGLIANYPGGGLPCLDGTEYAFERRRKSAIFSGTSSSSCDRTYEKAAALLLRFAHRHAGSTGGEPWPLPPLD